SGPVAHEVMLHSRRRLMRMGLMRRSFATIVALLSLIVAAVSPAAVAEKALAGLRQQHPRIIVSPTTWVNLRAQRATDPQLAALLATIEGDARNILNQPPVEYRKLGRRLLDVSRRAEQ